MRNNLRRVFQLFTKDALPKAVPTQIKTRLPTQQYSSMATASHPQPLTTRQDILASVFKDYNNISRILSSTLESSFETSINLRNNGHHSQALRSFENIIAQLDKVVPNDLTQTQREFLARSLYHQADILYVGSTADEKLAYRCLKRALAILPSYREARELLTALEAEGCSDTIDTEDSHPPFNRQK